MKNQDRDSKGRFSKMWSSVKKWFKRGMWVLAIAMIGGVSVDYFYLTPENLGMSYTAPTMVQEVMAQAEGKSFEEKLANVKSKMLDDLSLGCETKGVKDPNGAIIFDSNAEASIGAFQFQRKTVIHYVKKYEGRDITNSEAIAISIDPVKSKALAEKIIFTEKEGAGKDWVNCNRKLGLTDKVAIIKELEIE